MSAAIRRAVEAAILGAAFDPETGDIALRPADLDRVTSFVRSAVSRDEVASITRALIAESLPLEGDEESRYRIARAAHLLLERIEALRERRRYDELHGTFAQLDDEAGPRAT